MAEENRCPNCNSIINPTSECDYCGFEFTLVKKGSTVDYSEAVRVYRKSEQFKSTGFFKTLIGRGCDCCGSPFTPDKYPCCEKCGFESSYLVDDSDEYKQRVEKYRKEHLKPVTRSITNVCVVTYQYGWDAATSKFELQKTDKSQLASELKSNGEVVWSNLTIGQYRPDGADTVPIEVEFTANGSRYTGKCTVMPVESDDFWHLGIEMTKDYQLVIYLGARKGDPKAKMSTPIDLSELFS